MAEDDADRSTLEQQIDDLGDQLSEIRKTVEQQAGEARARLDPFLDQIRSDWDAARAAAEETGAAAREAFETASGDLEADITDLRANLGTVQADLRTELAESRDSYRDALGDLVSSWRARIDELRVQADLGAMDARDEARAEVDRAERQWEELKARADDFADQAAEATAELRADIRRLVDDLRATLRKVADQLTAQLDVGDKDDDGDGSTD